MTSNSTAGGAQGGTGVGGAPITTSPIQPALNDLGVARLLGVVITAAYFAFALLAYTAGIGFLVAVFLLIAVLFAYGTAEAERDPGTAKGALVLGAIIGAPFGFTMLYLVSRISRYEKALKRYPER